MAKPVIKIQEIRDQTQWVRISLLAVFVVLMALILPKNGSLLRQIKPGTIWGKPDLVSEVDFARPKAPDSLAAEREAARRAVPPVLRHDTTAESRSLRAIHEEVSQMEEGLREFTEALAFGDPSLIDAQRKRIKESYGSEPDSLAMVLPGLESKAREAIKYIFQKGYADSSLAMNNGPVVALRKSASRQALVDVHSLVYVSSLEPQLHKLGQGWLPLEQRLIHGVLTRSAKPQYVYDHALTEEARKTAEGNVMPVLGKVAKGEVIVRHGELVTEELAHVIEGYHSRINEHYGNPSYLKTLLSQLALIGMITVLMAFYLQSEWPRIYYRNRKLAFMLLLLFLTMALVGLALKLTQVSRMEQGLNFIFLTPVCMVPIVLTAFFDSKLGFFGNLVITIFISVVAPNGVEYLFIQFCAGTIAVYSLRELRNRAEFFLSLFFILLTYVVTYLGYNFFLQGDLSRTEWSNLPLLGINVVLTIIAFPLIYLFERIFGLTSDMTYIELLDTNHPLLKDLAIKAPGTFQHSLQVAHITEAVLNRIGGNALMARVGALYHDIGKARNPRYFIENLGDEPNPHEELTYEESAEIIIRHVTDGIKMGHDNRLPAEIIHFIRTHHGTSRVEYFYRKHIEDHPADEDAENRFSYPGPLPFSREMAVLMICDGAEAACRAMKHRTPENVKELVENIVRNRVKHNQFEAANITFKDLEDIKQVVYQQLLSMYHSRIEYPAESE
jgi:putative nucleotidyltransferase with HDIG domain